MTKLYSGNRADHSVKKLAFLGYTQSGPWNKVSLPGGSAYLHLQMAMQKRTDLLRWYYRCQFIPLSEIVGLQMPSVVLVYLLHPLSREN